MEQNRCIGTGMRYTVREAATGKIFVQQATRKKFITGRM